jgi:hypothetical protein
MRRPLRWLMVLGLASAACISYDENALPHKQDRQALQDKALRAEGVIARGQECSKEGREEFRRLGWNREPRSHFIAHYNERLKKCFVEVEFTDEDSRGRLHVYRSLGDTLGREYANYIWIGKTGAQSSRSPPAICEAVLTSGEVMGCDSMSAFNEIAGRFMESTILIDPRLLESALRKKP